MVLVTLNESTVLAPLRIVPPAELAVSRPDVLNFPFVTSSLIAPPAVAAFHERGGPGTVPSEEVLTSAGGDVG